jgi:hypothetical protein
MFATRCDDVSSDPGHVRRDEVGGAAGGRSVRVTDSPARHVNSVVVACPCGEVYELRPEFAGRLLECPVCNRHLRAGAGPGFVRPLAPAVDPAFDRDVFLLRERVFTITSKYEVWDEGGTPILYVERPTFLVRTILAYLLGFVAFTMVGSWVARVAPRSPGDSVMEPLLALVAGGLAVFAFLVVSMSARPRRHVTVYRDDSRREVMMRVLQDQRVALLVRTYTVLGATGEILMRLRKNYAHNLLRKRWYVETPGGRVVSLAIEDSIVLSLLRRVLGSFFGLLRTNFVLMWAGGEQDDTVLGEFNRKFTLLDRYVLDLTADAERRFDRRVALALGVMLDTGERR